MQVEIKIPEHVILSADDNKVTIERKGLRSLANHGKIGETSIPYSAIASVDYKKPGLTRGNIIIVPVSGNEHGGGYGGIDPIFAFSAWGKKNAVIFGKGHAEEMQQLKEFIDKKIAEIHSNTATSGTNAADEIAKFKKLLDDGVINQEEFDAKKKQLLGL